MQMRPMQGVLLNENDSNLFLIIFPYMSLDCKLVTVQYREHENGFLINGFKFVLLSVTLLDSSFIQ